MLQKHRLRLADGMKVRIFGYLDFYAPNGGRLGLKMTGIDPRYTLGDIAQSRDEVIRRLVAEGLLDTNKRATLSPIPLRVGVVTSVGTAAWHDFHDELRRSGFGFRLTVVDVRVQGDARREHGHRSGQHGSARAATSTRSSSSAAAVRATNWRSSTPRRSPDDRHVADPRTHRAGPRGRPKRRRRRRPHGAEDAHRVCRRADRTGRAVRRATPSRRFAAIVQRSRHVLTACRRRPVRRRAPHRPAHARRRRARPTNGSRCVSIGCAERAASARSVAANGCIDRRRSARAGVPPSCFGSADQRLDVVTARVDSLDPAVQLARGWTITRTARRAASCGRSTTSAPTRRSPPRWSTVRSAASSPPWTRAARPGLTHPPPNGHTPTGRAANARADTRSDTDRPSAEDHTS